MPKELKVKVYFDRGGAGLLLGPIGCFDRGDVVDVPDRGRYRIYGVAADGCAWAIPVGDDRALNGYSLAEVLRCRQAGYPVTEGFGANERQSRDMGRVIVGNRERYGLPAVEVEGREAA